MRVLPAAFLAHLQGNVANLTPCWRVTRRDGFTLRGTQHDADLVIAPESPPNVLSGTYTARTGITGSSVASSSDLSVDNLEVDGRLSTQVNLFEISAADIESGLYDEAQFTLFLVNWRAPDDGQLVVRNGTIGNITRMSEGRYTTELRGMTQRLTQTIVRTMGVACDADLGDERCTVDLGPLTVTGTIMSSDSRRAAVVSVPTSSPVANYRGGLLTFTSGENSGYSREVKTDSLGSSPPMLEFYEPFPLDLGDGDTFTLTPGCDKSINTCKNTFNNIVNFQGYAVFTPTATVQISGGPATGRSESQALEIWRETIERVLEP